MMLANGKSIDAGFFFSGAFWILFRASCVGSFVKVIIPQKSHFQPTIFHSFV